MLHLRRWAGGGISPGGTVCRRSSASPERRATRRFPPRWASPPAAIVPFSPGRAEAPWLGNVVALGDAAARIEPLGGIAQDLAHRQLALLLELLPGRTVDAAERAEFNRRAALMADRAADWVAVHYAAPAAGQLFPYLWRSPELERALDQYVRRGRTPFAEEAPMLVQEWGALLQALGVPSGESLLTAAAAGDENDGGTALCRPGRGGARRRAALCGVGAGAALRPLHRRGSSAADKALSYTAAICLSPADARRPASFAAIPGYVCSWCGLAVRTIFFRTPL